MATDYQIARSRWFRAIKNICWSNPIMRRLTASWSDERYIKVNYWWSTSRRINLENPSRFTEKLLWINLHDHSKLRTICSDKYEVREYISEEMRKNGLPDILIPLYGVYDSVDEIEWDKLPEEFVLKANHGSGWNILVSDKKQLDVTATSKKLDEWLHSSYYSHGREHQYKDIKPKIVCEKFLHNNDGSEIFDYKFMCFNGKPYSLWVDYNRHTNHVRNFYDLDGNPQNFESDEPADYSISFTKPENYEQMIDIVKVLAAPFKHVRVDLYNVDGKIYFGELTFGSWGGFVVYRTPKLDEIWGDQISL